jgi:hypothetical protein
MEHANCSEIMISGHDSGHLSVPFKIVTLMCVVFWVRHPVAEASCVL